MISRREFLLHTALVTLFPPKKGGEQKFSRSVALARMELVMGPLPGRLLRSPINIQIHEEMECSGYIRKLISYQSAPKERVRAFLLIPKNLKHCSAGMLCLHQTTDKTVFETVGLAGKPNMQYGKGLAERGFVVIAPEYPDLGEHKIELPSTRWQSGSMKAIWDNIRAIDILQSLKEVDPKKIGCIGHSLGGHNGLFTAAFDERIKCVVTSCGFTSFARYYGGNLKGWSSNRYMPRIESIYKTPDKMPFDFSDVLGAILPRPIFVSAPVHDANFDVQGVRETIETVKHTLKHPNLRVVYPDCEHDFPIEVREAAYSFLAANFKTV